LTEEYSLFFEFINTEYSKIFETYEIVDTKYKERFVRELIIWAEKNESDALKMYVEQYKLNKIFDIKIFNIDIGSMKNQLSLSIKNNSAPDIVLGPHDWLEEWLKEGLIDEINLNSEKKDVFQVGIDAFTISKKLYGYAYRMESIALYYNADLIQEVPTNWSDMKESCRNSGTLLCVSIPGGGMGSDAYHNYFFIGSTGGYIFNYEDGLETNDIGLDNNYALEAADYLDFLVKEGVIASQDYGAAISAFQQGASPYLITGPWAKTDASSVNYKIAQIPTFDGVPAKPFVGLRGAMVTTGAKNKSGAVRFINEYFSTYELQNSLTRKKSQVQIL
jgi:maltose-binding protein MalE